MGTDECMMPVNPPIINIVINPRAKSIGVSKRILPPHMVPIQLKILTPVGMAINMVKIEKAEVATTPIPVVNI